MSQVVNGETGFGIFKSSPARHATFVRVGFSAKAAVHGKRRDSLLLELKLTLKIAQRNVILKDHIHV